MVEYYFTENPESQEKLIQFKEVLRDFNFTFQTNTGVFSKDGVDSGTRLLIDSLSLRPGQRVLDLGCGYGPIGIVASFLVSNSGFVDMVDINQRAVALAKANLELNNVGNARVWQSDGFTEVTESYDRILTNPPIRSGKNVIYPMVEQAFQHCKVGGGLMLVIRTKQGAKSMARKMEQVFGNVATVNKKAGYRILRSDKYR